MVTVSVNRKEPKDPISFYYRDRDPRFREMCGEHLGTIGPSRSEQPRLPEPPGSARTARLASTAPLARATLIAVGLMVLPIGAESFAHSVGGQRKRERVRIFKLHGSLNWFLYDFLTFGAGTGNTQSRMKIHFTRMTRTATW